MNIFATFDCPVKSAKALDNLRLNKMILESAQLLSTVAGGPLKPTHRNHPSTKWVAADPRNFSWLVCHLNCLLTGFLERHDKVHAYDKLLHGFYTRCVRTYDPCYYRLTSFANVTPFPELPVHEAYRKTLEQKWAADKRPPKWGDSLTFPGWENV